MNTDKHQGFSDRGIHSASLAAVPLANDQSRETDEAG